MKIPKSVIKSYKELTQWHNNPKKLSEEVEEWIESKGYDPYEFRTEGYSVLEMVDYGEASSDEIESLLIKQFEEMDKSKIL